jgi:hypothetical protein
MITLNPKDVEEMMVEFTRKYLVLEDKKGPTRIGENTSIMFQGFNEKEGNPVVVEMITRMKTNGNEGDIHSTHQDSLKKRVDKRRAEGISTSVILPKAIDYSRAGMFFESPYCKKARLFETAKEDEELSSVMQILYSKFRRDSVKELTRLEWEYLLPSTGKRISYFNPKSNQIENKSYIKFSEYEVIPDSRPLNQGYFWNFVKKNIMPFEDNDSKDAKIFRNIQEGLHDRIRILRDKDKPITGEFIVYDTNKPLATIIGYHNKELNFPDNIGHQLRLFPSTSIR